jgi:hypothetical protein
LVPLPRRVGPTAKPLFGAREGCIHECLFQAQLASIMNYLILQLEAGESETLTAYQNAMARFHSYSFGNIL